MRYVLLKHEKDNDFHVDFLLDCGQECLLTWQMTDHVFIDRLKSNGIFLNFAESPNRTNDTFYSNCHRIFDHRRKYLDFSGDIGDSRGRVVCMDNGEWELCEICAQHLIIKTIGVFSVDNSPITRIWRFEPPIGITLDTDGTSPDRLMQHLPPPDDENWVVSCTQMFCADLKIGKPLK